MPLLLIALKLALNASIFIRIEISRILHNSFTIMGGNSGSHILSVNIDYQLIYTKRTFITVTSLSLQQIREVGTVTKQEHVSITHDIECTCIIQWYTICMLCLSISGIVIFIFLNARKF